VGQILISLPLLVEASIARQTSNEGSFSRPAGREKAVDESGGNKPAYAVNKAENSQNAINKIAAKAVNTLAIAVNDV
jgi:hypothetical protein